MQKVNENILKLARKQLASMGQKAFKKKTTEKQRQAWRLKGAKATRLKFLKDK